MRVRFQKSSGRTRPPHDHLPATVSCLPAPAGCAAHRSARLCRGEPGGCSGWYGGPPHGPACLRSAYYQRRSALSHLLVGPAACPGPVSSSAPDASAMSHRRYDHHHHHVHHHGHHHHGHHHSSCACAILTARLSLLRTTPALLLRRALSARHLDAVRACAAPASGPAALGWHRNRDRVEWLHGRRGPVRQARRRGSTPRPWLIPATGLTVARPATQGGGHRSRSARARRAASHRTLQWPAFRRG